MYKLIRINRDGTERVLEDGFPSAIAAECAISRWALHFTCDINAPVGYRVERAS